jgi:hypothetical protein
MRGIALAAAVALAAAGLAAPGWSAAASAASTTSSGTGVSLFLGQTDTSTRSLPVSISGQIVVSFHGDTASGCASHGLCGYSGTILYRPPTSGTIEFEQSGSGRQRLTQVVLELLDLSPSAAANGGTTTAQVTLTGSGTTTRCSDAVDSTSGADLPIRHGRVVFTLDTPGSDLFGSRCAGPRDPDLLPLLPAPAVTLPALRRGHMTVSLAASRTFAARGLAGTIQSTLVFGIERPHRVSAQGGGRTVAYRELDVGYRTRVTGTVVERYEGGANPSACGPLGSCGAAGSVTFSAPSATVSTEIGAIASITHPLLDLQTEVGLRHGGSTRGVYLIGGGSWLRGGSAVARPAQGSSCSDSAPLGPGGFTVIGAGRQIAGLFPIGGRAGPGVTRCPGAAVETPTETVTLIPATDLAHRTFTIHVDQVTSPVESFGDYGYDVQLIPDLTVTFTRTMIHSGTARLPAGFVPGP